MEITREIRNIGPSCAALGYFDGVHLGHIAVLNAAKEKARALGVRFAVMSLDMTSSRALGKGGADIFSEDVRLKILADRGVDCCFMPDFLSIKDYSGERFVNDIIVGCLGAKAVFCGNDFRFGKDRSCGATELALLCKEKGVEVYTVPAIDVLGDKISSTRVKQALSEGDMPTAERMLGREYGFALPVYEEKHLARRLGFPTINQRFPTGIATPRFGVYYSIAEVEGRRYGAVSNLGIRPTVEDEGRITLETHILDFSDNLYGKNIGIFFKKFLRPEQRFDSVQQLKKAVEKNIEQARSLSETEGFN